MDKRGSASRVPSSGCDEPFTAHGHSLRSPPTCHGVHPTSADNSICWMSKAEFDQLQSKSVWRKRFAVWMHWNANGEYLTYTVPPGKGLPVWRGPTATQALRKVYKTLPQGAGLA
jgi:hypothetical protein